MAEQKKQFFRERTPSQISRLNRKQAYFERGLVEKIDNLDSSKEALEIRTSILPGIYHRIYPTDSGSLRKAYKHGDLIQLEQPRTQLDAYNSKKEFDEILRDSFSKLEKLKEKENNYIGYSFRPVQGNDKRKRIVPFIWLNEAARLFSYIDKKGFNTDINEYSARRSEQEGSVFMKRIPSRSKEEEEYLIKLSHVPLEKSPQNLATILSLSPSGDQSLHELYNIKFNYEIDREDSDVITFYPQAIASYIEIMKEMSSKKPNISVKMNPFILPSKHQAEFYKKLCNNVLIYHPSAKKLRKLDLAEKCMLLSRGFGIFGYDDFKRNPKRDGKLENYNWQTPT